MRPLLRPERLPIESREPVLYFAVIRTLLAVTAVASLAILGFPYHGRATAVILGLLFPWSLAVLGASRRSAEAGLNPLIAVGDFLVLGILLAVEPELYAPTHFAALFFVAAHAHFQGEQWSAPIGALPVLVLAPIVAIRDVPGDEDLVAAYESVFAAACMSAAIVVGTLRTAESSARIQARAVSRRAIDTEGEVRRRLAEAIHDGPIQELSSVDMMLASAEQAIEKGEPERGRNVLREARTLTRANVGFLREEILELGPYAFVERSFEQAVADCVEVWERRYGFSVRTTGLDQELSPEAAGALFRITQEGVANAGKHAGAQTVTIQLRRAGSRAVLDIVDDGRGFGDADPSNRSQPGHIGLASMRERAEILGGQLSVESDDRGTRIRVAVPA